MVKLSVGVYIARLTNQFWASKSITSKTSGGRAIKAFLSKHLNHLFYAFLGVSYVVVVISEAVECRPFSQYWQVTPSPNPSCTVALVNLFTMGILNILTDLTLVALPLPMVFSAKLPTKTKAETLLFMLFPLVNVAFTCYRLPTILTENGSQRYRILMASIDILISTASANALVVISFLQDRGFKKPKYRYQGGDEDEPQVHVTSSSVELQVMDNASPSHSPGPFGKRSGPLPSPRGRKPTWGSDEDLMRDDSDGGPSIYTTSAKDVDNEDSVVSTQGVNVRICDSTCHLSTHERVETSIVGQRRVEFEDSAKDAIGLETPSARQPSPHSGIVVETSWEVVRS